MSSVCLSEAKISCSYGVTIESRWGEGVDGRLGKKGLERPEWRSASIVSSSLGDGRGREYFGDRGGR